MSRRILGVLAAAGLVLVALGALVGPAARLHAPASLDVAGPGPDIHSPSGAPVPIGRLHLPPDGEIERLLRDEGILGPDASDREVAVEIQTWIAQKRAWSDRADGSRAAANEAAILAGNAPAAAVPITAAILAIPVEFDAEEELTFLRQDANRKCITVTERFSGPLHGAIPYPGGDPATTIDNQTTYYPSTEPDDYNQLIFGREGYTQPLRAGDPNVNDGAGADIRGLTVQAYFDAQSDDTVAITGTVAPWVSVPHSEAYFGIDTCLDDISPIAIPDEQLASLAELTVASAEAVKALSGTYRTHAFWKQFDRDDDGFVDALWILHAGRGQEYGGGSEGAAAIWSRASSVMADPSFRSGYVIHDNDTPEPEDDVRLGPFTMLPEDSDIGVMIEEFGHSFFDLPDLYTSRSSNSVGWWAPMSAGIWGGELAGTRPVNMPLFHRMVADCGGGPCGWADPIRTLTYTTPAETVILGQAGVPAGGEVAEGAFAGETIHEGLRIELPPQVEEQPNPAGEGGGAYSTADTSRDTFIRRSVDLSGASGPVTLAFDSVWEIPRIFGFGYVEVAVGGEPFQTLPDLDGRFTDDNPFGNNEGFGLTGSGRGPLRFDLSEFAGETVALRIRYSTFQGGPGTGWWVDNLRVGEKLLDDFESGLDAWQVQGWVPVPRTLRHAHSYLVEWRNGNGFDASLLGAYSTSFDRNGEWRVDRVPANLPGAVVMYRNQRYPLNGSFTANLANPPSYGSKYGLLVADPNFWPTRRPSGEPFAGRLESLDAALSLGDQSDFELEIRDEETGDLIATETITGATGARVLDDAFGVYPGFYTDGEGKVVEWDQDASVVLPSHGDKVYTTRITELDRSRPHAYDGGVFMDIHEYGSGDPGDENAAMGVRIEVVDQAPDGSWGALRVYNKAVDYTLEADPAVAVPGATVTYTLAVRNRGSVASTFRYAFTLPVGSEHLGAITPEGDRLPPGSALTGAGGLPPGESTSLQHLVRLPADVWPSTESGTAIAAFDDGEHTWQRHLELGPPHRAYLPYARLE